LPSRIHLDPSSLEPQAHTFGTLQITLFSIHAPPSTHSGVVRTSSLGLQNQRRNPSGLVRLLKSLRANLSAVLFVPSLTGTGSRNVLRTYSLLDWKSISCRALNGIDLCTKGCAALTMKTWLSPLFSSCSYKCGICHTGIHDILA